MSKFGAIIRPIKDLFEEGKNLIKQIYDLNKLILLKNNKDVIDYLRVKDALITQQFFLESILDYHEQNGKSRGSYLILRNSLNSSFNERFITPPGNLERFKFITSDISLIEKIQTIQFKFGVISINWEDVREIPNKFGWFENVWKVYTEGKFFH